MDRDGHSTRVQIYRIYRRIRFLVRHRRNRKVTVKIEKPAQKPGISLSNRIYTAYRKIRFIIKRHRKKTVLQLEEKAVARPEIPLSLKIYRIYRKIRFLWNTGALTTLPVKPDSVSFRFTGYPKRTFTAIGINSLAIFLLSYLLVFFITHLITALSASAFKIRTIIYYFDVEYLMRGYDWTEDAVIGVFSSGPLFSIFFSLVLLILYINVATENGLLRLFVLWTFCHFFLRFFGDMLVGVLLDEGFGYVIMYLFVMDTGKMIICLFAFMCLFTAGYIMTRYFLYSANCYFNSLNRKNRMPFILSQFIIPMILGNIIIILLKIPKITLFEILLNASMLLMLIPVLLKSIRLHDLFFDEEPRIIKLNPIYIASAFFLLIIFRIALGIGINL